MCTYMLVCVHACVAIAKKFLCHVLLWLVGGALRGAFGLHMDAYACMYVVCIFHPAARVRAIVFVYMHAVAAAKC